MVELGGALEFHSRRRPLPEEKNILQLELQGKELGQRDLNENIFWLFDTRKNLERLFDLSGHPIPIDTDEVSAVVNFQCIKHISNITIRLELRFPDASLLDWQLKVFNGVKRLEQQKVDKEDQEAQLVYNTRMTTYHNRMAELRATAINDLLQGQSDAFNRQVIRTELKRLCLAMLTKEFDTDDSDTLFSNIDAMDIHKALYSHHQFKFHEDFDKPETSAGFELVDQKDVPYPMPKLKEATAKGRYIQFLEQAFEWQQLAYVFYPYFWATLPKWIDLMSRQDQVDPNLSAFLQAGSSKVLLAVTPTYEDVVMHYLATGEPWEGGAAPVIGDPLYIPLYEELRKQQDDLAGAVAEGKPWRFSVPTSLVYLENSSTPLPKSECDGPI